METNYQSNNLLDLFINWLPTLKEQVKNERKKEFSEAILVFFTELNPNFDDSEELREIVKDKLFNLDKEYPELTDPIKKMIEESNAFDSQSQFPTQKFTVTEEHKASIEAELREVQNNLLSIETETIEMPEAQLESQAPLDEQEMHELSVVPETENIIEELSAVEPEIDERQFEKTEEELNEDFERELDALEDEEISVFGRSFNLDQSTYIENFYQQNGPTQTLNTLIKISVETFLSNEEAQSFIEPPGIKSYCSKLQGKHLLLITGAPKMGKAALAKHIGRKVVADNQADDIEILSVRRNQAFDDVLGELRQVISLKQSNQPDSKSTYLILGENLDIDLMRDYIDELLDLAHHMSIYWLFTAESKTDVRDKFPIHQTEYLEWISNRKPYTKKVISQIISSKFDEKKGASATKINNIASELFSPSLAALFSDYLLRHHHIISEPPASWKVALDSVKDTGFVVHTKMSSIDQSERLMLMFLALFDELPEHDFFDIYESLARLLKKRDASITIFDYDGLLPHTDLVTIDSQIGFKDSDYKNELLSYMLQRRRRSLIETLGFHKSKLIDSAKNNRLDLRTAYAQTLGNIGIYEWDRICDLLYELSSDTSIKVRVSIGQAFAQMLERENYVAMDVKQALITELYIWQKKSLDTSWEARWTLSSVIGRIYPYLSKFEFENHVYPLLLASVKDSYYEVRKSAVFSTRFIGKKFFAQIKPILNLGMINQHGEVKLTVIETLSTLNKYRNGKVLNLLRDWTRHPTTMTKKADSLILGAFLVSCNTPNDGGLVEIFEYSLTQNSESMIHMCHQLINRQKLDGDNLYDEDIFIIFDMIAQKRDEVLGAKFLRTLISHNLFFEIPFANIILQRWESKTAFAPLVTQIKTDLTNRLLLMEIELNALLEDESKLFDDEVVNSYQPRLPGRWWGEFHLQVQEARHLIIQNRQDVIEKQRQHDLEILQAKAHKVRNLALFGSIGLIVMVAIGIPPIAFGLAVLLGIAIFSYKQGNSFKRGIVQVSEFIAKNL